MAMKTSVTSAILRGVKPAGLTTRVLNYYRSTGAANFIHELTHAAGGIFVGANHQQIVAAMAEVDGFSFRSIQTEIEGGADKLKLKGGARADWIEQRYSNRMNNWIGNYCTYEGGNPAWKDYIKNH